MPLLISLHKFLINLSVLSLAIAGLPALYFFKKHEKPMRVFASFIAVSIGFEIYAMITAAHGTNNMGALHVYTVIEYSLIAYFFSLLDNFSSIKKIILLSALFFSIGSLIYSFVFADLVRYNGITRTLESAVLTLLGFYYYYRLFENEQYVSITKYSYFWVNSGIVIYFFGNFVIAITYNTLLTHKTPEITRDFWNVHSLLNIIANIFYLIAFIWSPHQHK